MTLKFDLIDIFANRPLLRPLASKALRAALKTQFPNVEIDPDVAAVTQISGSSVPKAETLTASLRQSFSTGKTLSWTAPPNALIANPDAATPLTLDVDVAQLAVLVDSVSLGLLGQFMQSVTDFWNQPSRNGKSPWQCLAEALQQQSFNRTASTAVTALSQVGDPQPAAKPDLVEKAEGADFERLAQQVLERQLSEIEDVLSLGLGDFDEIERYLHNVTDVSRLFTTDQSSSPLAGIHRLDQLPEWLRQASSVDRLDYSRKVAALATVTAQAKGKSFDDNLPPILEYAGKALQDSLRKDHPEAVRVTLDDVIVDITKVVASAVPSGGQIVTVGSVEKIQMSAATFALENLASLPDGSMKLVYRDGGPLPDWLTADYLKQLVTRVDIGRTYPEQVRHYLMTDMAEVARRQTLFADQLRVQLPLKALEQKIRGEGALTEQGYRHVCAVVGSPGAGDVAQSSVMRALAFVVQSGAAADEVSNMFVMGGRDLAVGPVILYRPFASVPLTEFASWAGLRTAIAQTGELQQEVLTWMSEPARQRYANGGFDQPHIVRFGLGSDFAPIETPTPAQLAITEVSGDVFQVLFSANARALVDLADRESVSNAESRWALFKRGGWLVLDNVMPFVSGAVGSALWLVQLMTSVDQVLAAESRKAGPARSAAWNSLLLTVSLILLHQGFSPRLAVSRRPASRKKTSSEPRDTVFVTAIDVSGAQANPVSIGGDTLLDFSWSSVSHRLTGDQSQALERLKVSPEPILGAASTEVGHEGLYHLDGTWYARVDNDIYRVSVADDSVFVVDPATAVRSGPRLIRKGLDWTLDLSLRLRGGAPKRNVRQLAQENAAALQRVTERKAVLLKRQHELYHVLLDHDKSLRVTCDRSASELIPLIEAQLKEIIEIVDEKKTLDQSLRPADRVDEKTVAIDLQGVSRRISFFEGVLFMDVVRIARTNMAQLQAVSGGSVTPDTVATYLALFDKLLALQDKGVHWSDVRVGFWQALRDVPKVGETFWREGVLEQQHNNLLTQLEWRIDRLWSLLELSFTQEGILSRQGAKELQNLRNDESLLAAFSSHAELEKPNDYSLTEQMGVLESSLREYNRASLMATAAHESEPGELVLANFMRFLDDLAWISERAEKRLSDLIRESDEPSEKTSEYVPRIRQPRKRVIRTRAQRTLIGQVKEGDADVSGEVVEVTRTASDSVIGVYHQHSEGEWVEVEVARPARPAHQEGTIAVAELQHRARAALERVTPDINSARRQSKHVSEPEDMQDILVQKADRLSVLADKLAAHAADSSQSETSVDLLQAMVTELRTAASRLRDEGHDIRVEMIKAQPPTAARLSYLAREHEVSISGFEGRKNMSGSRRNDFLQEYVIRDKDQRVLWWAHFHYASEAASPDAFTAAHLKMPEQRFMGYKALLKAAKDNKEVVSIYRSAIGKALAQRLFPGLTPEAVVDND